MIHLGPSAAERRRGTLTATHRKRVLAAMQRDGVLVLDQIVDHAPLDELKTRMDRDSVDCWRFATASAVTRAIAAICSRGHRRWRRTVSPGYVANPLICDALRTILGEDAYCEFYNGNTNCPDSTYQQLHLDAMHDRRRAMPRRRPRWW